MIDINYCRWFL